MISKIFTHTPDLTIQPLRHNNPEALLSCAFHNAGACYRIQNRNPRCHASQKCLPKGPVHLYQIFLLMIVSCTHDPVYQISLISHQKQPLRFLVQPADRINSERIIQIFCHRNFLPLLFRTAHNPPWFVKQQKHLLFFLQNRNPVHTHLCTRKDAFSHLCRMSVYRHSSFCDHFICFPSGTGTCIT